MQLSKDAIWQKDDVSLERLEIPEWGGHVFIRTMTARQREEWESKCLLVRGNDVQVNSKNVRSSLALITVCDETGKLLFDASDEDQLNDKSSKALERIFLKASEVNRIAKEDVEELVKNSSDAPDDSSPSV